MIRHGSPPAPVSPRRRLLESGLGWRVTLALIISILFVMALFATNAH